MWVFLVVRSVQRSDDFWEGSGTPRDGRRGKLKHDGVRIFSRISTMAPGIPLILPGYLFTLVSRGCITLFRDLSRMVFTLRLLKGTKDT